MGETHLFIQKTCACTHSQSGVGTLDVPWNLPCWPLWWTRTLSLNPQCALSAPLTVSIWCKLPHGEVKLCCSALVQLPCVCLFRLSTLASYGIPLKAVCQNTCQFFPVWHVTAVCPCCPPCQGFYKKYTRLSLTGYHLLSELIRSPWDCSGRGPSDTGDKWSNAHSTMTDFI